MMHKGSLSAVILLWMAPLTGAQQPTGKIEPAAVPCYASPQAVFDAHRNAVAKKDTRAELYCYVPEIREDVGFAFCTISIGYVLYPNEGPQLQAALKKFGADNVMAEYVKQFKAKYGYDPVKEQAETEARYKKIKAGLAKEDELRPERKVLDEDMIRKIANERFTDRVAALAAIEDSSRDPDHIPDRYSGLRILRTSDNVAYGVATQISTSDYRSDPRQPPKLVSTSFEHRWVFRKVKGCWLISEGPRGTIEPPPPRDPNKPPPPVDPNKPPPPAPRPPRE